MTAVLDYQSVWFRYAPDSPPVLRGVTLSISAGEGVALVGPNGAGKTTLTRLAIGLARPTEGRVVVTGLGDTAGQRPEALARRVGYLFQHADRQIFAREVLADVAFGPRQLGVGAVAAEERARRALDALGLTWAAGAHPYDLAPPHRKLVALAGVLALEPAALVLDEPTAGLDRALRWQVIEALRARRAAGVAVLAVTHDLTFAAETLDRVVALEAGSVTADQPAGEWLWAREAHPPSPPVVALARALGAARPAVREGDVAALIAERWRAQGRPSKF